MVDNGKMLAIFLVIALLAAGSTEVKSECLEPQDLAIVLDGSSSVCGNSSDTPCPNWDFYRKFIHKLVDSMPIGPDDIRVAVVTYSDKATVLWGLNENLDKVSLLSAIDNIVYPGGGRNTSGALRILLTEVFASSADERPDTTTTAILITNGVPTAEKDELAAAIVDLQYSDVITFAVGVTKAVPEFIPQYISSDPHELDVNYFMVEDYDLIDEIRNDLQREVCSS